MTWKDVATTNVIRQDDPNGHDYAPSLGCDVDFFMPAKQAVMSLGRIQGLTVYDASYEALAQQLAMPLATLDGQLIAPLRRYRCRFSNRNCIAVTSNYPIDVRIYTIY